MLWKVSLVFSLAYALISEAMIARARFRLFKVAYTPIWHRKNPSISVLSLSSTAKSESEIEGLKAVNDNLMTNELKLFRKLTAEQQNKPLYSVFPNSVINSIVIVKPTTLDDLGRVKGIGPTRLKHYGHLILDVVNRYTQADGAVPLASPLLAGMLKPVEVTKKKPRKIAKHTAVDGAYVDTTVDEQKHIVLSSLNEEQRVSAKRILQGGNFFITGSAGTGKSYLLKYLIQELAHKHGNGRVAVTAPTGVAAVNIGGQTLHYFSGIGLGNGDRNKLLATLRKSPSAVERWQLTEVLIIDEISMLDKALFETLDCIARSIRGVNLPFGGMQLLLVGDFLQLPPIGPTADFCFKSNVWDDCGLSNTENIVFLRQMCRQTDIEFMRILNEVRQGRISDELLHCLDRCLVDKKQRPNDDIIPTMLYCTNKDIDEENNARLASLTGSMVEIEARDQWKSLPSSSTAKKYAKDLIDKVIPNKINLKVGAQVMLLRNRLNSGSSSSSTDLVNGSRGVVVAFVDSHSKSGDLLPVVKFDNGQVVTVGPADYAQKGPAGDGELIRYQVPLKLAWAISVHKSQGITLSRAELSIDKAFDYGQVYVALSRLRNLEGLWLTKPIPRARVRAAPEVLDFYKRIGADTFSSTGQ